MRCGLVGGAVLVDIRVHSQRGSHRERESGNRRTASRRATVTLGSLLALFGASCNKAAPPPALSQRSQVSVTRETTKNTGRPDGSNLIEALASNEEVDVRYERSTLGPYGSYVRLGDPTGSFGSFDKYSTSVADLAEEDIVAQRQTIGPALIEALNHSNPIIVGRSASILGRIRCKGAVTSLCRIASDPKSPNRSKAALAIGSIGSAEGLPTLIGLLETTAGDADHTLHQCICRALERMGPQAKDAVPILCRLFTTRGKWALESAKKASDAKGHSTQLELERELREIAADAKEDYFAYARVFGRTGAHAIQAVPLLAAMLDKEKDTDQRVSAAICLARIGPSATLAVSSLARAVDDESERVRAATEVALWNVNSDLDALTALTAMVTAKSQPARQLACEAIAEIRGRAKNAVPRLSSSLASALNDEAPNVRILAAVALWRINSDPRALPALMDSLPKCSGGDLGRSFLRSQHRDGFDDSIDSSSGYVAQIGFTSLGEMGPQAKGALPLLLEEAHHYLRGTPECIAKALTRIDRVVAIACLEEKKGNFRKSENEAFFREESLLRRLKKDYWGASAEGGRKE